MAKSLTPRLKKLLTEADCYFERQGKGDYEIWFSQHTQRRFVVDSAIKSRHTANAVLKQAGLPKAFRDTNFFIVSQIFQHTQRRKGAKLSRNF